MVQRYEQTRKLQWYKRGAAYMKRILAVMKKQIERFGDISLPSKMLW